MIADVFTVRARKLEPTLVMAALAEGVCPLCSDRLASGFPPGDRRRVQTNAVGGYCAVCDIKGWTLINQAGERRVFVMFRAQSDGQRYGRDTLAWRVSDLEASMARHPSGRQRP